MNLNMRTLAISIASSGLLALASTVAFAQNNNDNTSPGEAGHGTGCSNHVGGCGISQESSASGSFGSYQPTTDSAPASSMGTTAPTLNPDNTTSGESGHGTGLSAPLNNCMDAADATPGHCISGGTNK